MRNHPSWFSRFANIFKSQRYRLNRRLAGRVKKRLALARLAAWNKTRGRFESLEPRVVLAANDLTWAGDVGSYWSTNQSNNTNWVGDGLPAPGDRLIFGDSQRTQVENDFTAGSIFAMQFGKAKDYVVTGNTITLPTAQTAITVTGGQHQLGTAFIFTGDTSVDVTTGASVTLSANLSGAGGLTKKGDGELVITGPAVYTGNTKIEAGMLDVGRNVQLASLALSPTSTLAFALDGATTFDKLAVTNTAVLDGTLAIEIAAGFTPALGDTFQILSYGQSSGSFTGYSGMSYPGGILLPIETPEGLMLVATPLPTGSVSVRVDSVAMAGALADFFETGTGSVSVTGQINFFDQTIGGSFTFASKLDGSGNRVVTIAASSVSMKFNGGDKDLVTLTDGSGLLVLSQDGFAGSLGVTLAEQIPDIDLSGSFTLEINTGDDPVSQSAQVGSQQLTINLPAGPFVRVSASNASISTAVAAISGNFAFETSGRGIQREIAFGATDVAAFFGDARDQANPNDDTGVALSQGTLLALVGANGTIALDVAGNAALLNVPDLALAGAATIQINTTDVDVDRTIRVGGKDYRLKIEADLSRFGVEDALFKVANFVELSGDFLLEKSVAADGMTTLMAGVSDLDIFLGVRRGQPDEVGVAVDGGSLGLVIEIPNTGTPKFAVASATGTVSLVGVQGLELSGSLAVNINRLGRAIDVTVPTPGGTGVPVRFTSAGNAQSLSGDAKLKVDGFTELAGAFAFDMDKVNDVDRIKVAGSGIRAFLGQNPDGVLDGGDEVGVQVSNAQFAALLLATELGSSYALDASGAAALVGVTGLTLQGSMAARVNRTGKKINETIGGYNLVFDSTNDVTEFSGSATLAIEDFFRVEGSLGFNKSAGNLAVSDGKSVDVNLLTIGGDNLSGFVGNRAGTADQVGLSLSDIDFALALASDAEKLDRRWTAVTATAGQVALVGIPGVTLAANSLGVQINRADADGDVIDFLATPLRVSTGTGTSLTIDLDGGQGELLRALGNLEIGVDGFITATGNFAVERGTSKVTLADSGKSVVDVELLTIGANDIGGFVGTNGGTNNAIGLTLGELDFALALASDKANPSRKWAALTASVGNASFVGITDVNLKAEELSLAYNRPNADGVVVDFNAKPLEVLTGPGSSLTIDHPGEAGALLEATGRLLVDVSGFFQVSGEFAIRKASQTLRVDGADVAADLLTIGASGVNAFAGINGGSDDAIGMNLADVEFALALASQTSNPEKQWIGLKASAGSAAFVGLTDVTIGGSDLAIEISRPDASGKVADFAQTPVVVKTGVANQTEIDFAASQGALLRVVGNLSLDLFGFLSFEGGFAIGKSVGEVRLAGAPQTPVEVDLLTIGASDVEAFAGLNSEDSQRIGLALAGVELGLALATSRADASRKWAAVSAQAAEVAAVGIPGITLSADTLSVAINRASSDGKVIDFAAKPLTIPTGPNKNISLSYAGSAGQLLQASGNMTVEVAEFFRVSGGFAISKSIDEVTLSDGNKIDVELLTIGASGVNAFAGNHAGTNDAIGLSLSQVDFALAIASDAADAQRKWTTLQASASGVALVGVQGVQIEASDLSVLINRPSKDGVLVDYEAEPLSVKTGPSSTLTLDVSGEDGPLIQAMGSLELNVADFFSVSGDFAVRRSWGEVTLSDASKVDAELLTIGGANINAFAGLRGGTQDAVSHPSASGRRCRRQPTWQRSWGMTRSR
jgi:autotransporter-associated beta strand protein